MATYEFISCYKVWRSVKIEARNEDEAWDLFDYSNREDDIEIEASLEDVRIEVCDE